MLIQPKYKSYNKIADNFIRLIADNQFFLYSVPCNGIVTKAGEYENFYAFSRKYVISKRDRQLGLLDWCGRRVLAPRYSEIQPYGNNLFRAGKAPWPTTRIGRLAFAIICAACSMSASCGCMPWRDTRPDGPDAGFADGSVWTSSGKIKWATFCSTIAVLQANDISSA